MSDNKEDNKTKHDVKNPLEWTVFVLSLALVLSLFGYLIHRAVGHTSSPPDLKIEYRPAPSELDKNRYYVKIINRGRTTAEEVKIELRLLKAGQELETSDLQVPYVPQNSFREGYISFYQNPNLADSVTYRIVSFKLP